MKRVPSSTLRAINECEGSVPEMRKKPSAKKYANKSVTSDRDDKMSINQNYPQYIDTLRVRNLIKSCFECVPRATHGRVSRTILMTQL